MSHVFISYKHGDFTQSDFLQKLETTITAANVPIWRDNLIKAGENWETAIDTAIDDSFALLLLMTQNVSESQYVTYEWTRALTLYKPVIPLYVSPDAVLHPRLEKTQYVDFVSQSETAWKMLTARLIALQQLDDAQKIERKEREENDQRRIFQALTTLYNLRTTNVTAEDILTELRSQNYLSLADYARLVDLSRQNKLLGDDS